MCDRTGGETEPETTAAAPVETMARVDPLCFKVFRNKTTDAPCCPPTAAEQQLWHQTVSHLCEKKRKS